MTRQSVRNQPHDVKQAASQAAQLLQRQTCELCAHLRSLRPMCMAEQSPHYRQPREPHHDRCANYAVKGKMKPVKPEVAPVSRAAVAGEVAKNKHNRWIRKTA